MCRCYCCITSHVNLFNDFNFIKEPYFMLIIECFNLIRSRLLICILFLQNISHEDSPKTRMIE